jgi:2-succinyl-6-hydroxy-2,4-cyclohexadiene-1-carboxylate synthase
VAADLVLLHGFTQTGRSWDGVRERLEGGGQRYREVAAPDLRGHGAASDARPASFAAVTADLDAVVAPGALLAGYSMGGRIALHYALARPGRVARLVLIGASPGLADPAERAARRAADDALADRIERIGVGAFAEEWAALPLFAGQPPEARAIAAAERRRNTAAGLAAALRGLGTGVMAPLWDRLGELAAVDVDLLAGERDEKFRALAGQMAARLERATLTVVPGAGHAVHLEAPGAVAAVLR